MSLRCLVALTCHGTIFSISLSDVRDGPRGGKAASPDQLTTRGTWAALVMMKVWTAKLGSIARGLIWMMAFKKRVLEMKNVICIKIRGTV